MGILIKINMFRILYACVSIIQQQLYFAVFVIQYNRCELFNSKLNYIEILLAATLV